MQLLLQTEVAKCVLACISMVARHFGLVTNLAGLRKRFNISSHGTNLNQIHAIAAELEMCGRALQIDPYEVDQL